MDHYYPSTQAFFVFFQLFLAVAFPAAVSPPACKSKCGSIPLAYPLGTGQGCGSPRFHPSITCTTTTNQLLLTTHTGAYPITTVDYSTSSLTLSPPLMSTCGSMQHSPNFGLDWDAPLQPATSHFLLLACSSPAPSLTYRGKTPLCETSYAHLCAALYSSCPSVMSLGLPLFSSPTSCCVYSPANLGPHGDLDVEGLGCAGWTSVASLGDVPTDPTRWEYGVVLKFESGDREFGVGATCSACEKSGGVCGYNPPENLFVCVCNTGVNTSSDCSGQSDLWSGVDTHHMRASFFSNILSNGKLWMVSWIIATSMLLIIL